MKNPLSVAATVLKPYESASLYEKEGQMKLQPLLERKQKMQQAESEFAGVMADIDKYSKDVWEQDWKQVAAERDKVLENAAQAYERAFLGGGDLGIMERYQIQKDLSNLSQQATTSKANKAFYDKTAYEIMKNPNKYDVGASLELLNKGYKEGQLGARSPDNFMVPRFDEQEFMKGIHASSTTIDRSYPTGGSKRTTPDLKAIEASVIYSLTSDPAAMQWFGANYRTPEEQRRKIAEMTEQKAREVDPYFGSSTKEPKDKKEKLVPVMSKMNIESIDVKGTKSATIATTGAKVLQLDATGIPINTPNKGLVYVQGVFLDKKTNKYYVYGNDGAINDGAINGAGGGIMKPEAVAVPYDDVRAAVESATGLTKKDIDKGFGAQSSPKPAPAPAAPTTTTNYTRFNKKPEEDAKG